jgi:hypothetical protein
MKKWVSILIVLMLISSMVFGFAGCGGTEEPEPPKPVETAPPASEEPEEPPIEEEPPEEEQGVASGGSFDLADVANYWIEIDGKRYSVTDPFNKLAADFDLVVLDRGLEDKTLSSFQKVAVGFEKELGAFFLADIVNTTNSDALVKDCTVMGFSVDEYDTRKLSPSFVGGIAFGGTTQEDILAMFGEPDRKGGPSDGSSVTLEYQPVQTNAYIYYHFKIDVEKNELTKIKMSYVE